MFVEMQPFFIIDAFTGVDFGEDVLSVHGLIPLSRDKVELNYPLETNIGRCYAWNLCFILEIACKIATSIYVR